MSNYRTKLKIEVEKFAADKKITYLCIAMKNSIHQ